MKSEQELREDVLACLMAGLEAADPERLVRDALEREESALPPGESVLVVGFGKAALRMSWGADRTLGDRILGGTLIVPHGSPGKCPPRLRHYHGAHPIPDAGCVAGAQAVRDVVLRAAQSQTQLLCLISGGGSALLTLPPAGIPLEEIRTVTRELQLAGADIRELNCVRKHLDQLKGGRLARIAGPAPILALVLSDVVGDPCDAIASGPVSPDPTAYADAVEVLKHRGLWGRAPEGVRRHLQAGLEGNVEDSPRPDDACFASVRTSIVGNARTAAEAAVGCAQGLGYDSQLLSVEITGEAREAGRVLGQRARAIREGSAGPRMPACLVAAGETAVTVRGAGKGGRNQELVLAAAMEIEGLKGVALGSLGTDGIDGPTDVAGAIATGRTVRRAREQGHNPSAALGENDSYTLFHALGDHIQTGPTGTNVTDLQIVLVSDEH